MSKSSQRRIALQKRKRANKKNIGTLKKHLHAQNNDLRAQLSFTRLISAAVLSKLSKTGACVISTSDIALVKDLPVAIEQTDKNHITVSVQFPAEEPAEEEKTLTLEPDAA